jgi:WD40 repeat protein
MLQAIHDLLDGLDGRPDAHVAQALQAERRRAPEAGPLSAWGSFLDRHGPSIVRGRLPALLDAALEEPDDSPVHAAAQALRAAQKHPDLRLVSSPYGGSTRRLASFGWPASAVVSADRAGEQWLVVRGTAEVFDGAHPLSARRLGGADASFQAGLLTPEGARAILLSGRSLTCLELASGRTIYKHDDVPFCSGSFSMLAPTDHDILLLGQSATLQRRRRSDGELLGTLEIRSALLNGAAVLPDGNTVLAVGATWPGVLAIDATTGEITRRYGLPVSRRSYQFLGLGAGVLLLADGFGEVLLLDLDNDDLTMIEPDASLLELRRVRPHAWAAHAVAVDASGTRAYLARSDGVVCYDLSRRAFSHRIEGDCTPTGPLALHPDRPMAMLSTSRGVQLWDMTPADEPAVTTVHPDPGELALSKDGRHAVLRTMGRFFSRWPLSGREPPGAAIDVGRDPSCWALHPDGSRLLAGGGGPNLTIVDLESGSPPRSLSTGPLHWFTVLPDGETVATLEAEGTLKFSSLDTLHASRRVLLGPLPPIGAVAFHTPSMRLVIADVEGRLTIHDLADPPAPVVHHPRQGLWAQRGALELLPDGKRAILQLHDTIAVVDLGTGARTHEFPCKGRDATLLLVHPDGEHIVTFAGKKVLTIWDLATGASKAPKFTPPLKSAPRLVPLDGTGQRWLCLAEDWLHVLDFAEQKVVARRQLEGPACAVASEPSADALVIAYRDGRLARLRVLG